MADTNDAIAARYERSRPGLELVGIEDAALPFSWVNLDVIAQERKSFPLLEEFTLRAIEAGLFSESDIGLLLGLEDDLVAATVVDLMQRDHVNRRVAPDGKWRVALTPTGMNAARELSAVTPVSTVLGYGFDRLTWTVTAFRRPDLVSQTQAREAGLRVLPGRPADLSDSDFPTNVLNRMLADERDEGRVEILLVRKITPRARLFLPAKLLIFADASGSEAQVGVVIDGEMSRDHELEIERLGGADALGISVAPPADPPLEDLAADVLNARVAVEEVAQMRASQLDATGDIGLATDENYSAIAPGSSSSSKHDTIENPLESIAVRAVGVHEHPGLLREALTTTRRRLLIVAPWIKRAVVDTDFLGNLERRLRQGTTVTIAHGYGPDDRGSDDSALRSLRNLQRRFPDLCDVARLENTHAKILVWDSSWVLTSFNWLSFRGDPARTYRMEEGTLIRDRDLVDDAYDRYLAIIKKDRRPG